jgi:hypothetical protein
MHTVATQGRGRAQAESSHSLALGNMQHFATNAAPTKRPPVPRRAVGLLRSASSPSLTPDASNDDESTEW